MPNIYRTVPISVRITPEQARFLDYMGEEPFYGRSHVVRKCIDDAMDRQQWEELDLDNLPWHKHYKAS